MNFLAHLYLSGDNEEVKFGNFIGDWIKGNKFNNYNGGIRKGILLHREIDSYTDHHPTVHESILKLRPAYGKHAGIAVDILYDHFLSLHWKQYSTIELEDYVNNFHDYVMNNLDLLPKKARRFAFPFIRNKRLMCYADLKCFEEVLEKMAIYTSMPDKAKDAMLLIEKDYDALGNEFESFFIDLREFVERLKFN